MTETIQENNNQQNPTRIKIKTNNNQNYIEQQLNQQQQQLTQQQQQQQQLNQSTTTTKLKLRVKPPQPKTTLQTISNSSIPTSQQIHQIKSFGTQLWNQIVHTADTNGRIISFQFMDLPSMLHYPDYYQIIKNPIALNLIKAKLDSDRDPYLSFEHLRSDLKRVFNNAKRYNLEDSEIYKDAKTLAKIVRKAPSPENLDSYQNNHQLQSESSQPKQKKLKLNFKLGSLQSPTSTSNSTNPTPATVIIPPSPINPLSSQSNQQNPHTHHHQPHDPSKHAIHSSPQNLPPHPRQETGGMSQQEVARIQAELLAQSEARLKARQEARELELKKQEQSRMEEQERIDNLRQQAQAHQLQLRQQAQAHLLTPPILTPPIGNESQPSASTPSHVQTPDQSNGKSPTQSQLQLPEQPPSQPSNTTQLPNSSSTRIITRQRSRTSSPASKTVSRVPTPFSPPKPTLNKNDAIKLKLWFKIILENLESLTDRAGRKLIEEFLTLPDKTRWKTYYQIIPEPIAFDNIQARNNRQGYKDFESFKEDVMRIFKNAQHFNEDGSMVWNDSKVLEAKFLQLIRNPPPDLADLVLPNLSTELEIVNEARPVTPPSSMNGLGKRKAAERRTPSKQISSDSPGLAVPTATVALRRSSRSPSRPSPSKGSPMGGLSPRPVSPLPKRVTPPAPASTPGVVFQPLSRTNNNNNNNNNNDNNNNTSNIIIPPQLPTSSLRPASRLANDISPALLTISSSNHNTTSSIINTVSNHLQSPSLAAGLRTRSMAPIPVKISDNHPPMMTRFKITSRPKTMENLKIMNQNVFQHAFQVPKLTKMIAIETVLNKSWPLTRQLRSSDRLSSIKVKIESIKIQGKYHQNFNPTVDSHQDSNSGNKEKEKEKERDNGLVSIEVELVDGMNVVEYSVIGKTTDSNNNLTSSSGNHNATLALNTDPNDNSINISSSKNNNLNGLQPGHNLSSAAATTTTTSSSLLGPGVANTSSRLIKECYRLFVYR